MFDFEVAVHDWRRDIAVEEVLTRDHLDELEDHLRSTYVALVETGFQPDDAFEHASHAIGAPQSVALEYRKSESMAWRRMLIAGWAMFAVAWVLPVHKYGVGLFEVNDPGLPGFEAFWLALSGEAGTYGVLSALTNFLMLGTLWKVGQRSGKALMALGVTMVAAAAWNSWWMIDMETIADLRPGYFAWWGSFGVVATGLAMRAWETVKRAVRAVA